ncbi:ATP-binding protein [Legionella sp. km772]|uniref:ATP-binding protein n=1 Tax=Legionella sp. km772 TaxID=2498111 RepID=UPI000F8D31C9|nr:ATP-binding protein [Legionella sp. km772]RUR12297.1 HAMP domain-containing protein [Legionella sp. km772]
MRSLYWKIFLSFWLASIFIIVSIAWVASHITQKSSQPAQESAFMDSYANAAVATFESGQHQALLKWLSQIGLSRHMTIFLLSNTGEIIGARNPPESVKTTSHYLVKNQLPSEGIFKSGKLIVSHEILSSSGKFYRLAAVSETPISHFFQIPWAGLTIRLTLAIFISGLICYLLSLYLTRPLRSLGLAAQSIATGKLHTRVGPIRGHSKDEIAKLSHDFDRMAEELENLVHSKERLLQDISHELRSPLARLNIAIELGRKKAGHLASAELDRMELESSRLNALITEILEFARLEKSTTELHRDFCDMHLLLAEIIHDGNFEFNENNKRLVSGIIEPCTLNIDRRLIHRALENVVRNALHYTPSDKTIKISLKQCTKEQMICIEIQDNGPGVPEEQLQKIFNPFYRVDTSRTKKTGGYGLGLAIAYRAITLHQGTIEAINMLQGGLLVRISLPMN